MTARPILFSGPMVRAILDGRKSQTRRLVRIDDTPISERGAQAGKRQRGIPSEAKNVRFMGSYLKCDAPNGSKTVSSRVPCPYGVVGDALWVKESWSPIDGKAVYAADYTADDLAHVDWKWKSPRFMPRRVSRITLKLTDVRVQRLQDISEEDEWAEGVDQHEYPYCAEGSGYRMSFARTWDSLNAKRAPWASDPWVWALTFKLIEAQR